MNNLTIKVILISFAAFVLFGCLSESIEDVFVEDEAQKEVYESKVEPIIESKCLYCHYHESGSFHYDSFNKVVLNAEEIKERIFSKNTSLVMPPVNSEPLTGLELNELESFFNLMDGTDNNEVPKEPVEITWTAYKFPVERAGVSGFFTDIDIIYGNDNDNLIDRLENTVVVIKTDSAVIGNKESVKTFNIVNSFFKWFSALIIGEVMSVSENTITIKISMNNRSQDIVFDLVENEDSVEINGAIEDLSVFDWEIAYDKLDETCGDFHQNVLWPDIDVTIKILK